MRKQLFSLILILSFVTLTSAQVFVNVAPEMGVDITSPFGDVFAVDFNGDEHDDLIYTSRYDGASRYFQYSQGNYEELAIGLPQTNCDVHKVLPMDFDHDGDLDVLLAGYHYPSQYMQNNDGLLVDRTQQKGLPVRTGARDIACADLNHDGWMDIITGYAQEGWRVYQNSQTGTFSDITEQTGLPPITNFHRFCESDIDLDGDVDLFMTTTVGEDYFFLNINGEFEDRTISSGLINALGYGGCLWADFNNDKFPDLLTGGNGEHSIWKNNGDATFTLMNMQGTIVSFDTYAYSATYAAGDYDQDGDLDIYAGQPDGGWWGLKPDQFFHCDSIIGLDAYFHDIAPAMDMAIEADTKPHFFDYDRDGDLDLFLRLYGEPSRLYQNTLNTSIAMRIRLEGPHGEKDCWVSRAEIYLHGTETFVACGETNYGGARRDGFDLIFTLDPNTAYDLRAYFGNGEEMTSVIYDDLSGFVPANVNHQLVLRRGVGVLGGTPVSDPAPVVSEFKVSTYPNPFNATTSIQLDVPVESVVSVNIFDLQGRLVVNLAHELKAVGSHRLQWNAENVGTGLYILQVTSANFSASSKLVLIK